MGIYDELFGMGKQPCLEGFEICKAICALADEVRALRIANEQHTPRTIEDSLADVVSLLSPDVVSITVEERDDWAGDRAKFFMVILSDDAARERLGDVAQAVGKHIEIYVFYNARDRYYTNYRSVSEQAKLDREGK